MFQANDHVLDHLDSYLHEALAPGQNQYIEKHCQTCRICAVGLEEAQKRQTAFLALPGCEASEQLIQGTLQKIDAEINRKARGRRLILRTILPALAASVAILGGLNIYYLNLAPSPYDLTILGQAQLWADSDASLRVRVIHHDKRTGIEGAPVAIDLVDKKTLEVVHLASFTTDGLGTGKPRFHIPDWLDGAYDLRVIARPGGTETLTRTVRLRRAWKVMLSSDRPVYQPGQTIHVRALALGRMNLKPVAGREAIFTISDPKGNVIFKQKDLTSKFGICSVDCALADEIIEGTYLLRCALGDTESKLQVEVKKYVLPKFKVEITTGQPFYQPGQRIEGKVQAKYFFGKPVAGASVELVATSVPVVGEEDEEPDVLQHLNVKTDDTGMAKFEFEPLAAFVLGQKKKIEEARVEIRALVTDTAGQKQGTRIPLAISAQPLRIELVPEGGTLVADVPNIIYVLVSTPDGKPVKARVVVSGQDKELATDKWGVGSFELTPQSAVQELSIKATDDLGHSSNREVRLECTRVSNDFVLRPNRAIYSSGDTLHLDVVGSGAEPVFVDLIKDGQTILTESIGLHKGRGECRIDLPADLFGSVQLAGHRPRPEHGFVHRTRQIFIRPPSGVHIRTKLDKAEYCPGANAQLQFDLTRRDGNPAPGALSLAAVDEAIFSILQQAPGTEATFFTADENVTHALMACENLPENHMPVGYELGRFACIIKEEPAMRREALIQRLLPFLENDRRVFEALDTPDWEDHLPPEWMDQQTRAILRGWSGYHTVGGSTHPESVRRAHRDRVAGLELVKHLWAVCGLLVGVFGLVVTLVMAVKEKGWWLLLSPAILLFLLWSVTPEVQKVREASARTQTLNELKQIGLAAQNARNFAPLGSDWGGEVMMKMKAGPARKGAQESSVEVSTRNTPPRIRDWFPETLLWRPELITDDQGHATLDLDLADSITTWRLTASAVTADGRLGTTQSSIKVFQPFFVEINLPVALNRGDEIAVPVVLYNYLDKSQLVELRLDKSRLDNWFKSLDEPVQRIELKPREVRGAYYRLRVEKVGRHEMQVTALGSGMSDAIKRQIEVVPDGRRVEVAWNGVLDRSKPARHSVKLPELAIEGSPRLFVKIYPSTFSQLVEGLDAIFQAPYGCFEQTSSTTYPNVLALDYLRRTKKSAPEIEAKAKHYIHLGYQRLLGFEVAGGGFDWFGHPPANRTLTAYGLMEFEDMAKVHNVDPSLIGRTRRWLLGQRKQNGSWDPEGHVPQNLSGGCDGSALARLSTSAYIAWAVFRGQIARVEATATRDFLLTNRPEAISDPHALALVAIALLAIDRDGGDPVPYLERLEALKQVSADGKLCWWQQDTFGRTTFYGSGRSGSVETTALAALALMQGRQSPATVQRALAWLVQQKDGSGTWGSTQATVLALKALLAGTGEALGSRERRRIELTLNGKKRTLTIPADQAEVMKLMNLSGDLIPGEQELSLAATAGTAGYQVVFRYHQPGESERPGTPLGVQVIYDKNKLRVGERVGVTAKVSNRMNTSAPMVLVELPLPAGFSADATDFDRLVRDKLIAKYQVQPRAIQVYLRGLDKDLALPYHLQAQMPLDIRVPAARAYEYYNPDRQGFSATAHLTVVRE